MRRFVLFALMLLPGVLAAQTTTYTFSVLPSMPVPQQAFEVQVALSPPTCTLLLPGALSATSPVGNVVSYYLDVPDYCSLPFPDQTRTYSVPVLSAGVYTFRFYICTNNTPPTPPCLIESEQIVFVGGAPQPSVIPSLSFFGLSLLLALTVGLGGLELRRE